MTVNGNDGEFKGDANIIEVPSLTQALQDENRSVRATAAWALENIGTDAVPALIQALQNPDANVRGSAAGALGSIGEGSEDVVPALTQTLKDPDSHVRHSAAEALQSINTRFARSIGNSGIWMAISKLSSNT